MIAYVGLGSNLDNPIEQLSQAVDYIGEMPESTVLSASSVYRTAPIGKLDQPDFYNQVIAVETALSAQRLLNALLAIEAKMGRVRETHWGPRVIDCDLLIYGEQRLQTADLILPHPRMSERAFVLFPLREIDPGFVFDSGQTIHDLCATVSHQAITRVQK